MRNIKMIIQFEGAKYKGWQKQNIPGATAVSTIQDKFEKLLSKMTGEQIQVIGCGRTDTGVHARNYVANFNTHSNMSVKEMNDYLMMYLPEDIVVKSLTEVSERFHSRLNVKSKTYVYTIDNNTYTDVFLRRHSLHIDTALDIKKMKEGAKYLIGTHDFQSFTNLKAKNGKSTVRTLNYINIDVKNNIITFEVNGNGFLLNMVRILVGTLVKVGLGEISPSEVGVILEKKSRSEAGYKVPGRGLCMENVEY